MKTRPTTPPQSAANIWMRSATLVSAAWTSTGCSTVDIGRTSIGHRALDLDLRWPTCGGGLVRDRPLGPQDLGQRGPAHLELRLGRLAGADGALQLVPRSPERPRRGRIGVAL